MNATEAKIISDRAYVRNNKIVLIYYLAKIQESAQNGLTSCIIETNGFKDAGGIHLKKLGYDIEYNDGNLIVRW